MKYWLMKSEPQTFSFDDLKKAPGKTEPWDGIRNYQARNFMRDEMKKGDKALFYHSACAVPAVVGLAEITREAYPDPSALDPKSPYYDPKATADDARWCMVDVRYKKPFKSPVTLKDLKAEPRLKDMLVVQRGQRLSIQPVEKKHYNLICQMGGVTP